MNYNPNEPEAEFYSRGSDARLPYLNFNPIQPEAEFDSREFDSREFDSRQHRGAELGVSVDIFGKL